MDRTPSDSNVMLSEAIRKLEDYSLQQIKSNEQSSVSKTIGLVRSILVNPFDTRFKKHQHQRLPPNKNEVLIAIEFINRNRLFIEKLKKGTPAEQELAEKYTKTINSYNESCDKRIQGCTSRGRLTNFFSKDKLKEQTLPRIAMVKKVTVQHHYPENSASKALHKLYSNTEIAMPISKQSAELFHMKAIIILEGYGISSNEARAFVKNSPIYTTIEKNDSICTLTQTLSLFPGQTIIVKGNTTLDPKTQSISHFLPESFTLIEELTQTGFPHATQRVGWTVASQLIPDAPQRIDLLGTTAKLFQRRNQAVAGLSQKQGDLLKHAKALLSLKKKAFEEHAIELIQMHENLAMTILQASFADPKAYHAVGRFYQFLRNHPHPFDMLAETSQTIRECFMVKPHQTLLDAIIKGKTTDLGSTVPESRYEAAKTILDQAVDSACEEFHPTHHEVENLEERIKSDYIGYMGNILGKASKPIFLQYLSEDLVFEPPFLTPFESKVQAAAYLHLEDFLDELSVPLEGDEVKNSEMVYQLLKKQIASDIDLFKDESVPATSNELADYFQKRYLSLSSL